MNEKQRIEQATAIGFLGVYNRSEGADFKIIELRDAPDIVCSDSKGNKMNLEITLTEDRYGDIQDSLGRSDQRSVENLSAHLAEVKSGKADLRFGSLGNALSKAATQIGKKLLNRYGANTALVVRDTSGVDWDWDCAVDELCNRLNILKNPFDKGIWIINNTKTKIYRII